MAGNRAGMSPSEATSLGLTNTRTFMCQRRIGDHPTLVEPTDQVGMGDAGAIEEDLVEHGMAGHFPQRPHIDTGLAYGTQEVTNPLVFR